MKARLKTREEMVGLLDENDNHMGFSFIDPDVNHQGLFKVLKFTEQSGFKDQYISEHAWYFHEAFLVFDESDNACSVEPEKEVTKDNFIDSLHNLVNKYRKGILKITIDKKSQKFNGEWL